MTSQTPGTGQAQSCAECGTRGEPGQSFCDACGAVLGWSGTPARATTGGTGSEPTARAGAGHPTTDTSAPAPAPAPTPANAGRTTADDDERGWDAFAHPGAGTGTARTGHDPAQAGATATAATGVRTPQAGTTARAEAPTAPTHPAPDPSPADRTPAPPTAQAQANAQTEAPTVTATPASPPAHSSPTPEPGHPAAHPHHDDEAPTTPSPHRPRRPLPTPTPPPPPTGPGPSWSRSPTPNPVPRRSLPSRPCCRAAPTFSGPKSAHPDRSSERRAACPARGAGPPPGRTGTSARAARCRWPGARRHRDGCRGGAGC
ncbi:hypothetical protein [Streptomyces europaeiscabiei]|uniref:hypothetical protein n=1 Tax=Streptomyces europaeiscabiei TaxID=146819 RepID=UPI0039908A89